MLDKRIEPVQGPAVWTASDLERSPSWMQHFTAEELDEFEQALCEVGDGPVTALRPSDVHMPMFEERLGSVLHELEYGCGMVVLRGLPVHDRFSAEEAGTIYWAICARVGRLVATEKDGELLNDVYDRGSMRDPYGRLYGTNTGGLLHTDGTDVVGLLCLHPALFGGESVIASSMTMYNITISEHPEWLPVLYKNFACDWKNDAPPGSRGWFPHSLYCYVDGWLSGALRMSWHISAMRFPDVARLSAEEMSCFIYLDGLPKRPNLTFQMMLEIGDIQLVNNYVTVHSRQPYVDDPNDPARRRHMLRYWISRSGISPRKVSPEFEFLREDYFGLQRPVPKLIKAAG